MPPLTTIGSRRATCAPNERARRAGRRWLAAVLVSAAAASTGAELGGELRLVLDDFADAPGSGVGGGGWGRVAGRGEWLGASARVEGRGFFADTGWGRGGVLELGDALLAWSGDWGSLTLGHQQVAWGRADIFRLLDQVNPQRYPDALWEDPADARLPLWMANLEVPFAGLEWQFLAGADELLDAGNPAFPNSFAGGDSDPRRASPEGFGGVRVGGQVGDLSLSLHWLEHPNLLPLWRPGPSGGASLVERQARLLGLSADWPVGPVVLRMEAAYTATETLDADARIVSQDIAQVLVGLDWQAGHWFASPQLYGSMLDPADGTTDSRSLNYASLLVRHRSLQDRFEVRLFGIWGLDVGERWLSLRLGYTVNDRLELQLHADRFAGSDGGLLAPFAELSRVGAAAILRF